MRRRRRRQGEGPTSFPPSPRVRGTGDSSAASKRSAAALGYTSDRFVLRLLPQGGPRRAPAIHRGYYVRARAVESCVRAFLLGTQDHPRRQVVSLGAGLDSLYFCLKGAGLSADLDFFEVDLPEVASRKAAVIGGSAELSALVGSGVPAAFGSIMFSGEDYKLLGVDLRELLLLEGALRGAGLNPATPTLIIAEVVLPYMEVERSDALIQWAAGHFPRAGFILYEQIHPSDPFGCIMQNHFSRLQSPLHSLTSYPDCKAQQMRFLQRGWTECRIMDMNEFYGCFVPGEEQKRIQALEPFDEFEEWHLKCSHYFILAASKGEALFATPVFSRMEGQAYLFIYGGCSSGQSVQADWCFLHVEELYCQQIPVEGPIPAGRHSHSACSWAGGVLIAGGLEASEKPLGSILFLKPTMRGFQWHSVETCPPLTPRYSHTAHVHCGKLLLVGGVWFSAPSVPGVAVIDLETRVLMEYHIDTAFLEWPLMLHNHSSVFMPDREEVILTGGGGSCFSFGTHLNWSPVCLDLSSIWRAGP
ncbi:tRNA wybutosine-synthesizing protein 4 isoform X3 [Candoia aspera]|uniref:tRNA wybutosine-synthesizing protein 4 isoform X3 n=1 Tax=Candoia aspera TaxID=51853 RepID=UPI002FD85128